jgi:hypothetical protein
VIFKLCLILTALLVVLAALVMGGAWYLNRNSARQLSRLERLSLDLQTLKLGSSTYQEAQVIAERYGTNKYTNDWGTYDCADGYFERCAYGFSIQPLAMRRALVDTKMLRHVVYGPWGGNATIFIKDGKVEEYEFSILFKTSDDQWRGASTETYHSLDEQRAVLANITSSYHVSRNDIIMTGFSSGRGYSLESMVTSQSTELEWKRAWHYEFSCLAQSAGCGEICDVIPDAWKDFYVNRGHFDVEKFGSRYAFCTKTALRQ